MNSGINMNIFKRTLPTKNDYINKNATKYCNNCGNSSHILYQCNMPIVSIGTIIFRKFAYMDETGDEKSQIESYVIARSTEKWRNENIYEEIIIDNYQEYSTYFHNLKIEFKKFIKEYNFKTFTYEDLYYRGKINELMEYLNIKSNIPFPIGVKYKKVKFHKKIKLI